MRDFWPEQNPAALGSRVRRDLAREARRFLFAQEAERAR
jgi:hypothetical protein